MEARRAVLSGTPAVGVVRAWAAEVYGRRAATRFRATSRRPARALPPATTPSSLRVVRLHGAHSIAMRPHANLRSHAQRRTRAPRHEPRVLFPWPDSAPAAALSRPCRLHAHLAPPSDSPRSSPETHWERRGHRSAARATASAPLKGVLAAARATARADMLVRIRGHTTSSLLLCVSVAPRQLFAIPTQTPWQNPTHRPTPAGRARVNHV